MSKNVNSDVSMNPLILHNFLTSLAINKNVAGWTKTPFVPHLIATTSDYEENTSYIKKLPLEHPFGN